MSAFYPGAGLDFSPVVLFPNISKWYYLDSQPLSEFGNIRSSGYERPNFIPNLQQCMKQLNFDLIYKNVKGLYIYYNGKRKQYIIYYTNHIFPDDLHIFNDKAIDTLVLCGFDTLNIDDDDERLLPRPENYLNKFKMIICNSHSYYGDDLELIEIYKQKDNITTMYPHNNDYWKIENQTYEYLNNFKYKSGLLIK